MSTYDILTDGIAVTDEQLPDLTSLTAQDMYAAFDGENDEETADLLAAHVERTIGMLRSVCTRLRVATDIIAVNDAILHLEHYAMELAYEAERDY